MIEGEDFAVRRLFAYAKRRDLRLTRRLGSGIHGVVCEPEGNALPSETQQRARKAYRLRQQDHVPPSLHFKKVGALWSARADDNHRALADVRGATAYWIWIGAHADYEKLIAARRRK